MPAPKINIKETGFAELAPGDFAILVTHEKIALDNQHVGRFGLRSKWARKGLVATTGAQIDPGFSGRLTVGLTNLTNKTIALPHMDDLLTVEFHKLSQPAEKGYAGPYQNKDSLGSDDIEAVLEKEVMSLPEMTEALRSLTSNVESLRESVKGMEKSIERNQWIIGIGIAVMGVIAGLVGFLK